MTGFWKALAALAVLASLGACGPLVGAAAVAGADAIAEDKDGGDGLL